MKQFGCLILTVLKRIYLIKTLTLFMNVSLQYLQLKIYDDEFFKNRVNIIKFAHQRMLSKINKDVDKIE